jgi:hypothetical protein
MAAMRLTAVRGILLLAAALAGAAVLAPEPLLAQCAMCKATVTQSPEGREMAGRLNQAILVMLAAPYLVFGTVAAVLLRGRVVGFFAGLARFLLLRR